MNRHYFERMQEKLIFLEVFNSSHFSDMSLAQWLSNSPPGCWNEMGSSPPQA